jgi:hypothetical protein
VQIHNKKHITLSANDVKDAIIRHLYRNQGISGIFDIEFKLKKVAFPSQYPQDCNYRTEFDGAEVTVDLNEQNG